QRQAAEQARDRSSVRFGLVMQGANDIILILDEQLRIEDANRQAVVTYGWSKEELLRMSARQLRTDEEAAGFDDIASRARAADGATYETTHRRKDGSVFPVEVSSRFIEVEGRKQWLSIVRDITERRRVQETLERFNSDLEKQVQQRTAELAARNNETQLLLDAMPDTVLLCDQHGTLLSARSVRYPAVAGLVTGQQMPGSRALVDASVLEIVRTMHPLALAAGQAAVQEFERPVEHGRTMWLEARAVAIGVTRVLIVIREISERKRHELGIMANLEREKQLSGMKSQFISVASHEFRTPLAAAVGSLELLERHADKLTEAKRTELITRIHRSLGRLTEIMDDVLQLSRADSGRVQVQRMAVDLVKIVEDIVRDAEVGDQRQHRFDYQVSGGPAVVPTDTKLLHHIVTNLVSNAVRYSPPGTMVTVKLGIGSEGFSLTVADEGIGIPEAERDRIFEPFVRGSNVGQIAGTGLGLNIVKRYTELMGGHIELVPSGCGTTFRVTLPFEQPPA
ncbi:MAG: PAS domain S-box protein, partial [Verrucomicrobia bacterium]|nr:PAS domain S-box protein [Verrucomicrobiota bacterium]